MDGSSSIFGQILHLFSKREFFEAVHTTPSERGAKGFTCWDHFMALLFCQLGQAHSLREICGGPAGCFSKAKHLGLKKAPNRSTLSYASEAYNKNIQSTANKCDVFFIAASVALRLM